MWERCTAVGALAFVVTSVALGAGCDPPEPPRSYDGSNNNVDHPEWGRAGATLLRMADADYSDGVSAPAGASRPSARVISNRVCVEAAPVTNGNSVTSFVFQWGQFIDHDMDLTQAASPAERYDIPVPEDDAYFPSGSAIAFDRSVSDPATGTSTQSPRQQINQITAFLDGSMIYGSNATRARALRTLRRGELLTGRYDLLPYNTMGLPNAGGPSPTLFIAGDVRANEQVGLTAMHVLFMREHNRIAKEIARRSPSMSDEEIYQYARAQVGAELQVITYKEFLPAILGRDALPPYSGYDPAVNAGISNEFSTAAFRFGHSMLPSELLRLRVDGNPIPQGNLALRDAFFSPEELQPQNGSGIEPLLTGLYTQIAREIDPFVAEDVRSFLFGSPGHGGFDLAAANIQRGRDHGLPSYNDVREHLGYGRATSFSELSSSSVVADRLASAYANVDDVDLWVGGLAEDHVPGALVGRVFFDIIVDQFRRTRDGDRYWYQAKLRGAALQELEETTLAKVIVRNTRLASHEVPSSVFVARRRR